MKLPAVAITAAFAFGIALGLCQPMVRLASSQFWLAAGFLTAASLIVAGILLVNRARFGAGAIVSGVSWMVLGLLGTWIADRFLAHVISLMERGQIDLRTPLRWRGTLRDEPAKLPWGFGLEIQLAGVDFENAHLTTLGGLRLSYSPRPGDPPLPELHAGDEVTVLTQAKRPQIFRDEGAFDRRTYLGTQGIDLVATLRSPELIDSLSAAPQTAGTVLARTRRQLREEVDTLFEGRPEVAAVKPRLAVISVGEDNPYGHPNAELLERLANAGVRVLRTDRDGAVHILMDGKGLEVRCFLPCLPLGGDELQRAQAPDRRKDEHQQ